MEKDYVTTEALVLIKDFPCKYPQWSHDCIAVVGSISSNNVQEPKAKAALIWMLGEYANILESMIENWEEEDFAEVRLHLLTASMKCFFRRPPETQNALEAALAAGIADFHQDVHDRALLYYRLLQQSVSIAEKVVNPPKQAVSVFADTQSSEIKVRIFDEFNSLSIVYQKPSYMYTDKEHRGPFEFFDELGNLSIGPESADDVVPSQRVEANDNDLLPSQIVEANDNDLLLSTTEKEDSKASSNNGAGYSAPLIDASSGPLVALDTQPAVQASQASFAIDDLLGLGFTTPEPTPAAEPSPPTLKLNAMAALDPGTCEQKWHQLPIYASQEIQVTPQGAAALNTPQSLLLHMQAHSIHCIASGGQSPTFKYFFLWSKS